MKLLTILVIVVLAFNIAQAQAESCEGGTLQTAENGHVYCRSTIYMNWWSAYTWCEAQGRHLASMYEICPTWDGSSGRYRVCNMNFANAEHWSATAYDSDKAFVYSQDDVYSTDRSRKCLAVCY